MILSPTRRYSRDVSWSKASHADWYTSARTGRTRPALVAQRIERLASDQKAGGSSPSEGTK